MKDDPTIVDRDFKEKVAQCLDVLASEGVSQKNIYQIVSTVRNEGRETRRMVEDLIAGIEEEKERLAQEHEEARKKRETRFWGLAAIFGLPLTLAIIDWFRKHFTL